MTEPRIDRPTVTLRRLPWWCPLVIVAAGLLSYHNSFHGPFVFDDASSIVTNPTIRQWWPLPGPLSPPTTNVTVQGRPIPNLSLAINYAIGGTAVESYHAVNVLIHLLAGLTLFGLIRRTLALASVSPAPGSIAWGAFDPTRAAFAAAVLWTVHPLQTESVTYIVQRAESLVGLFYLVTLYAFVRAVEPKNLSGTRSVNGWKVACLFACLLGMATKEVMATAPLMVLFFDRIFVAGTFRDAVRSRPWFYLALAGTWVLLGLLVAGTGGNRGGSVGFGVGIGWWDYWMTQFKAVAHYLRLSLWPDPLVFEYGAFWIRRFGEIAVGVVVVFGLLGATLAALWRRSAPAFLGVWFFGILAPTSLAPGTTQMIVEHRMYLPLAAVMVALVLALDWIGHQRNPRLAPWVIAAVAVAFIALTVQRNSDYRSELALWGDTVAKRPNNPLAHFMLGDAQRTAGNLAAARRSYERALDLKPDFSIGHEHLGQLLLTLNLPGEAVPHFESAVQLQPKYPDAHANLGIAYLAVGRIAEAVAHLEQAVVLMPDSAFNRYHFANALVTAGLPGEAIAEYQEALRLDSDMASAQFNLANALVQSERAGDAIGHYQAALRLRPDYAVAHYNLVNALVHAGRKEEAIHHYNAALRLQPAYPEAHHNLGRALYELGRFADAAHHYEKTLHLAPDFPNARASLDRARERLR